MILIKLCAISLLRSLRIFTSQHVCCLVLFSTVLSTCSLIHPLSSVVEFLCQEAGRQMLEDTFSLLLGVFSHSQWRDKNGVTGLTLSLLLDEATQLEVLIEFLPCSVHNSVFHYLRTNQHHIRCTLVNLQERMLRLRENNSVSSRLS